MSYATTYGVEFSRESIAAVAPATLYSLEGKSALVTGAAGGLGRWFAAGLAAAGADITITDRDSAGLEEVATVLGEAGAAVNSLEVDLEESGAAAEIVGGATDRFGGIDVFVNCAGINRRLHVDEVDADAYDCVTAVNLRIPFFLAQAVSRVMRAGSGGSIINIGSITCGIGVEHSAVYGATKSALAHLTKTMAIEWAEDGVRVNCLAPGFFMTPLGVPVWEDEVRANWMLDRIPLGRPGRADELVGLCLLLASDAGRYITGQTIYVDGGVLAGSGWHRATPVEA